METEQLLTKLYNQGIRKIEATWEAGHDDGYVNDVRMFPHDRHPTDREISWIKDLAWDAYASGYGGYTAGEFNVDGGVSIVLLPDGKYSANSYNNYSEEEYDDEDEEYHDINETSETVDNVTLSTQVPG